MEHHSAEIGQLLVKIREVAKNTGMNLNDQHGALLMIKCLAICAVSIGADAGESDFALQGIVQGGNRACRDSYEFTLESRLVQRGLTN